MEDAVPEAESFLHRQEECSKRKETDAEGKDDEERKGGLLDHIIHNLVSPLSPRAGDVNQKKDEVFGSKDTGARSENEGSGSEEAVGNVNGGGGLIKNVMPNFFRPIEQAQVTENEKKNEEVMVKRVEENEEVKKDDEGGGGGSIIGSIVSHLPTSLPGDVAPTADEVSMLIHSIIHD